MKNRRKSLFILAILILLFLLIYICLQGFFVVKPADAQASKRSNVITVTGGADKSDITVTRKADISDVAATPGASDIETYLKSTNLKGYTIILHTNDTHGRVSPDASKGQMGFTAVSALKKLYEAAGGQVILLDAGDTLHGTDFAGKGSGKRIVALMNLVGYDAMVPGNNDFNYGPDTLLKRGKKMNFPLISSNITYKKSGESYLKDHIIIEKNGVKYGVFGLTTTDTVIKEDPKDIKRLEFNDPVAAAKEEVQELKSEGAQVIIALAHLGVNDSSKFTSKTVAREVSGINLIVDGHSHTVLKKGLMVGGTLIVSTGKYLEHIGVVTIDPNGNMKTELINPSDFGGTDAAVDDYIDRYLD